MKNKVKFFMVIAAIFISGNLFAQSDLQTNIQQQSQRLHDLQLCYDYLSQMLNEQQMTVVKDEIISIQNLLQNMNAAPLLMTPFDKFLMTNSSNPEAMAYVKILAQYIEPAFFFGRSLSPAEKTTYENVLSTRAAAITNSQKF